MAKSRIDTPGPAPAGGQPKAPVGVLPGQAIGGGFTPAGGGLNPQTLPLGQLGAIPGQVAGASGAAPRIPVGTTPVGGRVNAR
jgi:hypothetical protein